MNIGQQNCLITIVTQKNTYSYIILNHRIKIGQHQRTSLIISDCFICDVICFLFQHFFPTFFYAADGTFIQLWMSFSVGHIHISQSSNESLSVYLTSSSVILGVTVSDEVNDSGPVGGTAGIFPGKSSRVVSSAASLLSLSLASCRPIDILVTEK